MKLNEKEFVDRLHDVESQLQCLKLLDHHKTKKLRFHVTMDYVAIKFFKKIYHRYF